MARSDLAERLAAAATKYGVRDFYVFGSRAAEIRALLAGELPSLPPSKSDVDIAAEPMQRVELSPRKRVQLTIELEDLLAVNRVDLVVLSEANAFLATEIVSGELLHTSDPHAQAEHELYVLRRAADLAPFRKDRVRAILESGAR